MNKVDVVIDAEANNLMPLVDKIHIIVVRQLGTGYTKRFHDAESFRRAIPRFNKVIGANILGYDLQAIRKVYGIPFTLSAKGDTWDGSPVEFIDTLHLSQLLNPDRPGGHSVEAWSAQFGLTKVGKDIQDWSVYTEEMGDRCENDTLVQERIYLKLLEEARERLSV